MINIMWLYLSYGAIPDSTLTDTLGHEDVLQRIDQTANFTVQRSHYSGPPNKWDERCNYVVRTTSDRRVSSEYT